MKIEIAKESLKRFFGIKDIRVLVASSLGYQLVMLSLSPLRKRSSNKFVTFYLWVCYQIADYVPILTLSNILKKQSEQVSRPLMAFWAPFFLLHLGGPDMMTSYSIEDNELWLRHFIGLFSQAGIVFWVMLELVAIPRLCAAAAFVFVTGLVKYAERALALRSASMDQLKAAGSMVNNLVADHKHSGFLSSNTDGATPNINDVKLIVDAYEFLKRFKPNLFQMIVGGDKLIDLVADLEEQEISQTYFLNSTAPNTFKVLAIELSFLYDVFHSKAIHIRGIGGAIWRLITISMISIAFIIFHNCEKQGYVRADIILSYTLLGGSLFMEFSSLVAITASDWMIVALTRHTWLNKLSSVISILHKGKPRWAKTMNQYNLLNLALRDHKESLIRRILGTLKVKEFWDSLRIYTAIPVPEKLKYYFYEYLKAKSLGPGRTDNFKEFPYLKGQRALENRGCCRLRWSVDKEFDESIVVWHVATDLCFYTMNPDCLSEQCTSSWTMSNYMLYFLVMQPSMMPAGSRQISFQDTCAKAKDFFRTQKKWLSERKAREALLDHVETKHDPIQVKGDRCKSVLFDACQLAKELKLLPDDERWSLIRDVWVEMLSYAAINCKTHHHVKRLNQGGEPLTHLWLLMAHLGIGMKYPAETV